MPEPSQPSRRSARRPSGPEGSPPRRGLRRWSIRAALGLLVVLGLLAGLVAFLLTTEAGARWLFTRLGGLVPGELEVGELSGPVRGPLRIDALRYRTDAFELTIDRLDLEWTPVDLLHRQLDIHRLEAEGVRVVTFPGPEEPEDEADVLPDVDLPVAVVLRQARVRDLRIVEESEDGGTPEPLIVQGIDLETRTRGDGWIEITDLDVRSPRMGLEVAGRFRPRGAYGVELETRWEYVPGSPADAEDPALPPFAGHGTLTGTLEDLQVDQVLERPVRAELAARLADPLEDLGLRGTLRLDGVRLTAFDPGWLEATVTGVVTAEGRPEELSATAELAAATAEWGDLDASLEARRLDERLAIDRLELRPAGGGTLGARGSVGLEEPLAVDLRLGWEALSWPLAGDPAVMSPGGEAVLAGTLDRWELDASAGLTIPGDGGPEAARSGRLELASAGGGEGAVLERAGLALAGGELEARGSVEWSPRVAWDLSLAGTGLDPSAFAADWPGALGLEGETHGTVHEDGAVGAVRIARLSGTLRGESLSGGGQVAFEGDAVRVPELEIGWGSARLAASGRLAPALGLEWSLAAPDLASLLPDATGSLSGSGRLSGPTGAPRIEASLVGSSVSFAGSSVGALAAEADLDLAPGGNLTLDLDASEVAAAGRSVETARVELAGTRGDHRLSVLLDGAPERLAVVAEGGLQEAGDAGDAWGWDGRLERLDLEGRAAGSWRLASLAPLAVATGEETSVRWGQACWLSEDARLCSRGAWSGSGAWRMEARAEAVPLALAEPLLAPDAEVTGRLDGRLDATADPAGVLSAEAVFTAGPGELAYMADAGEVRLPYQGRVEASSSAAGLQAEAVFDLGPTGSVAGELRVAGFRLGEASPMERALAGSITAELDDLGVAAALVEGLGPLDGSLRADLGVSGTLAAPDVSGSAVLTASEAELAGLGLTLRDLRLAAESANGGALQLEGSARSGEGSLEIEGLAPLAPSADAPARLRVTGSGFRVVDTPAVRADVTPELEVVYDGDLLAVNGEARVPEARIELQDDAGPEAIEPSGDVVFVGDEAAPGPEEEEAMDVAARVRVVLGEDVTFEGAGLEAGLAGSLLVVQEPGAPIRATGELRLEEGTFQAYGQDLRIERGRLVFAGGPVTNPGLDLRASREARDGTVAGLEAQGTLERPEVSIWSDPAMSQTDALSYLLLGRPVDQASQSEGNMLANAAGSLGVSGGNLLVERLASRFGLEEARIETEGTYEEAQLVLGTYLSPRLYVSYGVGLFEAVNTLRINYLLSRRFTLRTEVGEGTSADLLYSLERGRGEPIEPPGPVREEELEEPPEGPPESAEPAEPPPSDPGGRPRG